MIELPQITLCAIVKNEAENLPKGIGAVQWPGKKLIVDTGSTDGTPEIARECGCDVVHFEWVDDFAAARSVWHEHVQSGWIFWMDGDDTLDEDAVGVIYEVAARSPKSMMAWLTEYHYPNGYVCDHLRLYRAGIGIRWRGRIHEALDFTQVDPWYQEHGDVRRPHLYYGEERLRLKVNHGLFPQYDPEAIRAKSDRNMRLLRRWLEDEPEEAIIWQYIGTDLMGQGEYEEAARYLEESIRLADPNTTVTWLPEVYINLANCYYKMGRVGKSKKVLRAGQKQFDPSIWNMFLDRQLRMKTRDGRTAYENAKERVERHGYRYFQPKAGRRGGGTARPRPVQG